MTRCRVCKEDGADIYLNAQQEKTKTPICRECYERQIMRTAQAKPVKHRPGYVGPGRDPDHDTLDTEALDWWERQVRE